MSTAALLLAFAVGLPQQAVEHPLPPRTEQPPGMIALVGATLYPVTGPPIENGVMLVEAGRIVSVGRSLRIPAEAEEVDLRGLTVMPGIVESHSHMGLKQLFRPETGSDNNELSKPINAEVRAIDGIAAHDPAFRVALAAGITTMNITTGSRSFASGQAVLVKMRGRSANEMYLAPAGLKFAMRIASRNQWGTEVPQIHEMLRERLRAAQAYMRAESPPWDPQLEALAKALSGAWPVGVHAHAADAMRAAIALKDEFGLNLYIHHAEGTTELAEELAAKQIPISFGPVLPGARRDDPELLGPVRLNALGGSVSFHQDHPDGPQYYLRHTAALFVRAGMPEADALRALTLEPARLFGIENRIGSLEPGKDADFIVLDGPPLDWESRVRRVFIEGVEVFNVDDDASAAGNLLNVSVPGVARPAAASSVAPAAAPPVRVTQADLAIVGGEVRPVSTAAIPDGVVLVEDGRIVAVGTRADIPVPAGAEVIDATGLVVTPGFIDARTSVRRGNASDRQSLIRDPRVRMADDLRLGPPAEAELDVHDWVPDGVTAAYVAPGTDNLVAGFGAVIRLAGQRRNAVIDSAAALHIAFGNQPRERFDAPTTRQGMVAVLRQWLTRARAAAPGAGFTLGEPARSVEDVQWPTWQRTPDLDAVFAGQRPVRFHAHTPDDIGAALRVADEFGLDAIIEGGYGAHVVATDLADAGASVVVAPAMTGGGGESEEFARTPETAARLYRAGVPVAFSTDGSGGRSVTMEALVGRGHGLPAEATLRALTLDAARILGVDEHIGSLEAGKEADLVLWSGDPVGTWGEVRTVIVRGTVVFRR